MDQIYHALVDGGLGPLEKAVRTVLVYLFLLVALRLAGKRELGQLSSFDLVLLLLISSAIETSIQGEDNSITGGMLAAGLLLLINRVFAFFTFRHQHVKRVVEGSPVTLIENGEFCLENMRAELIDEAEVRRFCLQQGYEFLSEIARAEIDVSGDFTVTPRHPTKEERRFDELRARLERIEALLEQRDPVPPKE